MQRTMRVCVCVCVLFSIKCDLINTEIGGGTAHWSGQLPSLALDAQRTNTEETGDGWHKEQR